MGEVEMLCDYRDLVATHDQTKDVLGTCMRLVDIVDEIIECVHAIEDEVAQPDPYTKLRKGWIDLRGAYVREINVIGEPMRELYDQWQARLVNALSVRSPFRMPQSVEEDELALEMERDVLYAALALATQYDQAGHNSQYEALLGWMRDYKEEWVKYASPLRAEQ